MIATERDDPWVVLAVDGNWHKSLPSDRIVTETRVSRALKKSLVAVLNLFDSVVIVVRSNRNVAAIHDFQTRLEGIDFQRNVVPPIKS